MKFTTRTFATSLLAGAASLFLFIEPIQPAAAASAPPPSAPAGTKPLSTPSGVRSPPRRPVRKGAITRSSPRAIEPTAPVSPGGATTVPAVGNESGSATIPSAAAIERALSMPENADLRAWYESQRDFTSPRHRIRSLPFDQWSDDQACIVRRDGDTKFLRNGCAAETFRISASIDQAWADALEHYFGYPEQVLDKVAYRPGDGSLAAIEYAVAQSFAQHGILCSAERIAPDHQWILDRSAAALRPVAKSIIDAYWHGTRVSLSARQRIEALASYVQNAVPYRKVDDGRNDFVKDGKARCGLRTPAEVLLDGGDCDSKSLLLATLIRSIDIQTPVALVYCMNADTPHMCLAVGCDALQGEQCISVLGTPMVLIETTSDWDIGNVSVNLDVKDAEAQPLR